MSNVSLIKTFQGNCSWFSVSYLSSGGTSSYYLGIAMLASVMTVATIVINCIFVATMVSQKLIHKNISNKLLVGLSMVDLLQGISIWPIAALNAVIYSRSNVNCYLIEFNYFLGYHLIGLTTWTIFLIALEQYIAILHPYFYISKVTFHRLLCPVLVMQALRMVIDTVGKLTLGPNWNTYYNSVVLALWLPIMIALFTCTQKSHVVRQK